MYKYIRMYLARIIRSPLSDIAWPRFVNISTFYSHLQSQSCTTKYVSHNYSPKLAYNTETNCCQVCTQRKNRKCIYSIEKKYSILLRSFDRWMSEEEGDACATGAGTTNYTRRPSPARPSPAAGHSSPFRFSPCAPESFVTRPRTRAINVSEAQ